MKKLIQCLFIVFFFINGINGQDSFADSLKTAIAASRSDSLKIDALLQLTRYELNYKQNEDTALILLKTALSFSEKKNLFRQQALCLGRLAMYYFNESGKNHDIQKAKHIACNAVQFARKQKLRSVEIDLMLKLAEITADKGFVNADTSMLLIGQAITNADLYDLPEQKIRALTLKADYYATIEPLSARKIYAQAYILATQNKLPETQTSLLTAMANTYARNRWVDSASFFAAEAIRTARKNALIEQEMSLLRSAISSGSPFFSKDSLFQNYERFLSLSRASKRDSLSFMGRFAYSCTNMGNYPKALQVLFVVLHAYEERGDSIAAGNTLNQIGHTYLQTNFYRRAVDYLLRAKNMTTARTDIFLNADLAKAYTRLNMRDSAAYYAKKSYDSAVSFYGSEKAVFGGVLNDLGAIYDELGIDDIAIDYLRRSYIYFTTVNNDAYNYAFTAIALSRHFNRKKLVDSAFLYARMCVAVSREKGFLPYLTESSAIVSDYFRNERNVDSAYYYQNIGFQAYKAMYNEESSKQIQNMALAEQQREDDLARTKKEAADLYKAKLRLYGTIGVALSVAIIGIIVYRNSRRRQQSYELVIKQKQEIDLQKLQLESSLNELTATQTQLVHAEKMASLGELTAGIAHEIQNPLNFVNNFSEITKELAEELKEELKNNNAEAANAVADDIIENADKIVHHGKRADSIVKNMLQHSRVGSGKKQEVDINALTDEYLRLSYHGLRAKDKSFNADVRTDFDPHVGELMIIQQDIGRVLLNLFNNAFYALNEKLKADSTYQPLLLVKTSRQNNAILISIKDNGNGVPPKIAEKIWQPFFTTKPTGEGTGLGLSLSYDIITKGHNGALTLNNKEGQGAEFIITLPLKT